jgi:hypothetical protein
LILAGFELILAGFELILGLGVKVPSDIINTIAWTVTICMNDVRIVAEYIISPVQIPTWITYLVHLD